MVGAGEAAGSLRHDSARRAFEGMDAVRKEHAFDRTAGWLLSNRFLWIGIALGVLTLTHLRFRLAHHTRRGFQPARELLGAV